MSSSQLTLSSTLSPALRSPVMASKSPELPPLRQSPRRRPQSGPTQESALPKTNSYVFTHSLIRRTLLLTTPRFVLYNCTQPSCTFLKRMETLKVISIGNFVKHYQTHHKDIPISLAEEKQLKQPEKEKTEFFRKYPSRTTSADYI